MNQKVSLGLNDKVFFKDLKICKSKTLPGNTQNVLNKGEKLRVLIVKKQSHSREDSVLHS